MSKIKAMVKRKLFREIDKRGEEIVKLCADIVRIPSENSPGDTTELAGFLRDYLKGKGIKVKTLEPKENTPSRVATIKGKEEHPHLVMNPHMDVFPADVGVPWDFDPFGEIVKEGKIMGRGAARYERRSGCLSLCLLLNQ